MRYWLDIETDLNILGLKLFFYVFRWFLYFSLCVCVCVCVCVYLRPSIMKASSVWICFQICHSREES